MTKDATVYPVVESDVERQELAMAAPQMAAAKTALIAVQRALEPAQGWRASSLWETVEDILCALDLAEFDAWECPDKPKNFRHWREKYADPAASPF
jgi:hypothetical protein